MNSRFTLVLILLILWIILGSWLSRKYLCGMGSDTSVVAPIEEPKDDCNYCWLAKDGAAFTTGNVLNNFRFKRSGFDVVPMTAEVRGAVDGISTYLDGHADRALNITGYYDSLEAYSGMLSDLGLARANAIKNIFVAKGVDAGRINISSKYGAGDHYLNDTLNMGAMLAFAGYASDGDARLAAIKDRLFGKPITLYFDTGENSISLSSQQRTDFTDLIYYLDRVGDSKLAIGGHTDDRGNLTSNVTLSKDRAAFARDYLARNGGISTDRMPIEGYGPNSPIASNNSSSGRAKNRRVEVILQ